MNNKEIAVEKILLLNGYTLKDILKIDKVITANAQYLDCYNNVNNCIIKNNEGEIIYGWTIHKGNFLIQLEAHAVYFYQGKLICVTPDILNPKEIFFVKDKSGVVKGQRIDNIRIGIKENSASIKKIIIKELDFKRTIYNKAIEDVFFKEIEIFLKLNINYDLKLKKSRNALEKYFP